jgi:phosphatidylinositol alpha-1,6-mannosyltransferase
VTHLLVTNDFPPKTGGIQSYLWELWRRLPPESFAVLTTRFDGAAAFDAAQPFRVERERAKVLWPTRALARRIDRMAAEIDAGLVVLDPALPIGLVGRRLARPYGIVVHGAEIVVPGRLPITKSGLRRVLSGASVVVAAGNYPATHARALAGDKTPIVVVPPGVDADRFVPLRAEERAAARAHWGLSERGRLVVSVSRLVPRKGMDVLIRAGARLALERPDLVVAIAGAGRDRRRLERLIDHTAAPVVLLGRVGDDDLPSLYGCADVFAMLARSRWGGLEEEGFGIVFLEAAACGVTQVAGASGGTGDAVDDGVTGAIVRHPREVDDAAAALAHLLDDADRRRAFGDAGRTRACDHFSYDGLAESLRSGLELVSERVRNG